jgi:hypothetical protein
MPPAGDWRWHQSVRSRLVATSSAGGYCASPLTPTLLAGSTWRVCCSPPAASAPSHSAFRKVGSGGGGTVSAIALGLAAFALFLDRSRRLDNPLLSLHLLRISGYTGPTFAAALQQLGFFSWFFSTSFVLSEIWGWSVRETGQAISVSFIFSAITGWAGGKAAARIGMFWPTVIGAVVAASGPLYWALSFDATPSFWTVYLPGAALFGLGGGACGILTTGMALRSVSDDDQGMAYAAHQTARRMASSFGLALMATLLGEASGTDLLGGARNVWIMSAAAHLVMIIPLAVTSRKD